MEKATFLAKLRTSGLLTGELKTKLRSIPILADKTDYFLDVVVLPTLPDDTTNLDKLLSVMEAYNDNLKKLAKMLRTKCYT